MKLDFFPTPYPDELWYSVVCRYYMRKRLFHASEAFSHLYEKRGQILTPEAGDPIINMMQQFPHSLITPKDIILKHTFYPYYMRFACMKQKVEKYICVQEGEKLAIQRLGMAYEKGFTKTKIFKYCPECFWSDIATYGEPYWHRLHQIQDMRVCHVHNCWLVDTDVVLEEARKNGLAPATTGMKLKLQPAQKPPQKLIQLAELKSRTLNAPFEMYDGTVYRAVFNGIIKEAGLCNDANTYIYYNKISKLLQSFYKEIVPYEEASDSQLYNILRGKRASPQYILELIHMWSIPLDDLIK